MGEHAGRQRKASVLCGADTDVSGKIRGARACSAAGTGHSGSGPVSLWWWWCGPQSPLVVHQSWWMPQTRGGSAWSSGRLCRWWSQPAAKQACREVKNRCGRGTSLLSVHFKCPTHIFWDGDLRCDDWTADIAVWASPTYEELKAHMTGGETVFNISMPQEKSTPPPHRVRKQWDSNDRSQLTRLKVIPGRIVVLGIIGNKTKKGEKMKMHPRTKKREKCDVQD